MSPLLLEASARAVRLPSLPTSPGRVGSLFPVRIPSAQIVPREGEARVLLTHFESLLHDRMKNQHARQAPQIQRRRLNINRQPLTWPHTPHKIEHTSEAPSRSLSPSSQDGGTSRSHWPLTISVHMWGTHMAIHGIMSCHHACISYTPSAPRALVGGARAPRRACQACPHLAVGLHIGHAQHRALARLATHRGRLRTPISPRACLRRWKQIISRCRG